MTSVRRYPALLLIYRRSWSPLGPRVLRLYEPAASPRPPLSRRLHRLKYEYIRGNRPTTPPGPNFVVIVLWGPDIVIRKMRDWLFVQKLAGCWPEAWGEIEIAFVKICDALRRWRIQNILFCQMHAEFLNSINLWLDNYKALLYAEFDPQHWYSKINKKACKPSTFVPFLKVFEEYAQMK